MRYAALTATLFALFSVIAPTVTAARQVDVCARNFPFTVLKR